MKSIGSAGAALLLTTSIATAGGLDRSGQPIGIIFEEGDNVVQLTFGSITPSVSGTTVSTVGGEPIGQTSGNMANSYVQVGLAYKQQINDQLSFALIFDQPFGASVSYDETSAFYYTGPATAEVTANAITGVARYQMNENVSFHGGVRYQVVGLDVSKPTIVGYGITSEDSAGVGFVLGAAYEIPDIALRIALTYNSAIDHNVTATETCGVPACSGVPENTSVTTPQSINLDFQTGVAADTLVFGSIRWAEWTAFDYAPPGHVGLGQGSLQSYDNDVFTYSIGVGRKFSDTFSGALTLGYEAATGGFAGDLAPTDGNFSVGLGGTFNISDQTELTAGVRYIMLGDADTENPAVPTTTATEFRDNTAMAFGLQLTHSF